MRVRAVCISALSSGPLEPPLATDEELGLDVRMFVDGVGAPDLDPFFTEIDGAEAVGQAVALRCYCPRFPAVGHLIGAEDDGMYLPDFVQSKMDARTSGIVKQLVRAQALKDERVGSAKVNVTTDLSTQTMTVEINGTTSDDEPFELVLSVDDVTVEMLNE
jgi:hypothetical protein